MVARRMDLVDMVDQAGWPMRSLGKSGHYLVLPPGQGAITIATTGSDWRSERNALSALKRAGLMQAIEKQRKARDRERLQTQQRMDRRMAIRQAQADRLNREHEQKELMKLAQQTRRNYSTVGERMTLHTQELKDWDGGDPDLDPRKMLTLNEVADAMDVTPSRVSQLIHQGRLKATVQHQGAVTRYSVAWGEVVRYVSGE